MNKKRPMIVSKSTPEITIRFIQTLMDESAAMLVRHGETRPKSNQMSREFTLEVFRKLSGQLIYLGKNKLLETQKKRQVIRDDHKSGETIAALATKYQLSTRQIHTIIHEIKDTVTAKASTKGADLIAVTAARMFMQIGVDAADSANAARGLLAIISARFGGNALYIPKENHTGKIIRMIEIHRLHVAGKSIVNLAAHFKLAEEEITEILNSYPRCSMPDASELPKIRTRLFTMSSSFCEYAEINALLESAIVSITRVEEIINKQKGEPETCRH